MSENQIPQQQIPIQPTGVPLQSKTSQNSVPEHKNKFLLLLIAVGVLLILLAIIIGFNLIKLKSANISDKAPINSLVEPTPTETMPTRTISKKPSVYKLNIVGNITYPKYTPDNTWKKYTSYFNDYSIYYPKEMSTESNNIEGLSLQHIGKNQFTCSPSGTEMCEGAIIDGIQFDVIRLWKPKSVSVDDAIVQFDPISNHPLSMYKVSISGIMQGFEVNDQYNDTSEHFKVIYIPKGDYIYQFTMRTMPKDNDTDYINTVKNILGTFEIKDVIDNDNTKKIKQLVDAFENNQFDHNNKSLIDMFSRPITEDEKKDLNYLLNYKFNDDYMYKNQNMNTFGYYIYNYRINKIDNQSDNKFLVKVTEYRSQDFTAQYSGYGYEITFLIADDGKGNLSIEKYQKAINPSNKSILDLVSDKYTGFNTDFAP